MRMLGKGESYRNDINIPLMDDEQVVDVEEPAGIDRQYKDVLFLALFGINIVFVVSVALLYGIVALTSEGDEVIRVNQNGKQHDQTAEFTPSVEILLGMIATIASAVIATSAWIFTLSRLASFVLNAILISLIMVPIICGMVLFFMGFFIFGFTLLLLSVCLLVLSLFIRPRMDFAAVNLKVACTAVLQVPTVFSYALLAVGMQVLYFLVWGIATVGYATSNTEVTIHAHGLNYNLDECTTYLYGDTLTIPNYPTFTCASDGTCKACVCDGTFIKASACTSPKLYGWEYFWLLLSLFWTSAVFANIVHCTVASAVSRWWVVGYPSAHTVQQGFDRATTTSLGSICLASLLVAVVRTLRSLVHLANKKLSSVQASGIVRSLQHFLVRILTFFLNVLDRLVVYFNRYALCFVAIHRYDFLTASKSATNLFVQRGFTALLNDDIIDVVLNIGHVIVGIVSMCVGYVFGRLSGVGHAYTVLLTVFGFAAGYLTSVVALSTISSAVATVYVCYVENPLALQVSHPEMYVPLSEAWQRISAPDKKQPPAGGGGGIAASAVSSNGAPGTPLESPASTGGTRIRGSFGPGANGGDLSGRSQFEIALSSAAGGGAGALSQHGPRGQPGFTAGAGDGGSGGGAFSAGFSLIAALFPGAAPPQTSQPAGSQRMNIGTSNPNTAGTGAGTRLRGGYASLQPEELDDSAHAWGAPYPQHQQPLSAHPPGKQQQFTSAQPHHWGPPTQPHALTGHQSSQQQQRSGDQQQPQSPALADNIAQAFSALNSLTTKLSSSVFGPPPTLTGGASTSNTFSGTQTGHGASMMSVPLEESFSV